MPYTSSPRELIEKHRLLDDAIAKDRSRFPSDWDGTHPYAAEYLGSQLVATGLFEPQESRYLYFADHDDILNAIVSLHARLEGTAVSRENVLAGSGASSLLLALCLWLVQNGHTELIYIPPLYYTLHYFLEVFRIRAQPLTAQHVFEPQTLELPRHKSLLLLTDPAWFAGFRVPLEMMEAIARWQSATGSIVMIDGAFQFMQWERTRKEHSALLDPELTFRLVSPSKALAIPFFRFAYLLHPAWTHRNLVFLYENMVGGSTVADFAFARRSLEVLASESSNYTLTAYLQQTYQSLLERGLLRTRIVPNCGYFTFAVPPAGTARTVMDQDYFELTGYPDHVRINLMLAEQYEDNAT